MAPRIGIGKGLGTRNSGEDWASYWATRYLTGLAVTTTSDTTQTITATINGTGADGVSWEYSTDGVNYSEHGTSALGSYNATGLTAGTLYYWRARLYKGTNFGAYSNVGSDTTFQFFSDALLYLNGDIITVGADKYFEDKTANGRDFLITGYDFDSTWTKGFPYKSAATVSAPAGDAALIAADVNSFLYTAGTPNAIPVVSFFQNIDFQDRLFCKHSAQIITDDIETYEARVINVVLYANVKAGADLTTCRTFFGVPAIDGAAHYQAVGGNNANTGLTWALRMETMRALLLHINPTTTAVSYTGTGEYLEAQDNQTEGYWYAIGRVVSKRKTAFALRVIIGITDQLAEGFIADADGVGNAIYNGAETSVYNRCYAKNAADYSFQGVGSTGIKIKNSVLNANNAENGNIWINNSTFELDSCLVLGSTIDQCITLTTSTAAKVFKHNTFKSVVSGATKTLFYIDSAGDVTLLNNKFISAALNEILGITAAGHTGTFLIKNNYFNIPGLVVKYIFFPPQCSYDVDVDGNEFIVSSDITSGVCNLTLQKSAKFNNNKVMSNPPTTDGGVLIIGNIEAGGLVEIKNNSIVAYAGSAPFVIGADAGRFVNLDGIIVEKNKVKCSMFYDPNILNGSHGVFLGGVINAKIRYNYFAGCGIGPVNKGNAIVNTDSAVMYNLCIDNIDNLLSKGCESVNYFGNTIVRTTKYDGYDKSFYGVYLMENVGGDPAINTVIKNNIIINIGDVPTINNFIHIESNSEAGLVCDYNIYYCKNGAVNFSLNNVNKTFAQWQALGYDAHSIVLTDAQYNALFTDPNNGDFSLKAGSIAISAGVDLGAAYDDGLDASTDWGSDTEIPVVVTKQQGAAWDIGAYIH